MRRRAALQALGAAALGALAASVARPQPRARLVAVVAIGDLARPPLEALVAELRALGYQEGHDLELIAPAKDGGYGELAGAAAAAVARKADVIVAFGTTATRAAKSATRDIPIVMVVGADPVQARFVASLARPGGNVTGVATATHALAAKRVELLRELVPGMRRLAVLWSSASAGQLESLRLVEAAAGRLGVAVWGIDVERPGGLEAAARALAEAHADALFVAPSTTFLQLGQEVVRVAAARSLPAVYTHADFVRAGGLMSYSPDLRAQLRRAAGYVDRILKGASPGELPVEQPTQFELAVNLKTARALGITIPQSLLLRANEVIA